MLADLMLMIGTENRGRMQSSAMVSVHMCFLAPAFLPFWRKEKVLTRDCLPRSTPERKGKLQLLSLLKPILNSTHYSTEIGA